jgi:hypothetical protein
MLLSIAREDFLERWKKKMGTFPKTKGAHRMVRVLFLVLIRDRMATTNCLGYNPG